MLIAPAALVASSSRIRNVCMFTVHSAQCIRCAHELATVEDNCTGLCGQQTPSTYAKPPFFQSPCCQHICQTSLRLQPLLPAHMPNLPSPGSQHPADLANLPPSQAPAASSYLHSGHSKDDCHDRQQRGCVEAAPEPYCLHHAHKGNHQQLCNLHSNSNTGRQADTPSRCRPTYSAAELQVATTARLHVRGAATGQSIFRPPIISSLAG